MLLKCVNQFLKLVLYSTVVKKVFFHYRFFLFLKAGTIVPNCSNNFEILAWIPDT